MKKALQGIEETEKRLTNSLTPEAIAFQLDIDGVRTAVDAQEASLRAAIESAEASQAAKQNIANDRLDAIRGYTSSQSKTASDLLRSSERNESVTRDMGIKGQAAAFAVRDKVGTSGSLVAGAVNAVKSVAAATTTATQTVASRQVIANERLEAIRRKDFSPTVNISAKFSIQELTKGQKTVTKTFHSTLL
jgi:hypothetical protein